MTYTHKGWFWLCPIYLDLDSPVVQVEARRAWLEPLHAACEWLEFARIALTSLVIPGYQPTFMLLVTGELAK